MSDRDEGPAADTEPTQPIRPASAPPTLQPAPGSSWLPPVNQAPPPVGASWLPPVDQSPPITQPLPPYPVQPAPWGPPYQPYQQPVAQRGRVPGWMWPAVAGLALVLGLLGGAVGAALLDNITADRPGTVSTGLDGVDTENTPPLTTTNKSVVRVAD
ncbi:MAG: hypothetical protein ACXWDL_05135, partial [Nocardioides sp.]